MYILTKQIYSFNSSDSVQLIIMKVVFLPFVVHPSKNTLTKIVYEGFLTLWCCVCVGRGVRVCVCMREPVQYKAQIHNNAVLPHPERNTK